MSAAPFYWLAVKLKGDRLQSDRLSTGGRKEVSLRPTYDPELWFRLLKVLVAVIEALKGWHCK
jgi:hypothetical protein